MKNCLFCQSFELNDSGRIGSGKCKVAVAVLRNTIISTNNDFHPSDVVRGWTCEKYKMKEYKNDTD